MENKDVALVVGASGDTDEAIMADLPMDPSLRPSHGTTGSRMPDSQGVSTTPRRRADSTEPMTLMRLIRW
jgi:hypothetical protein